MKAFVGTKSECECMENACKVRIVKMFLKSLRNTKLNETSGLKTLLEVVSFGGSRTPPNHL